MAASEADEALPGMLDALKKGLAEGVMDADVP